MQLKDKTIIITGASSGIGEAAALLFAGEGANLILGARREKELSSLVGVINSSDSAGKAVYLAGDVCDEGFSKAMVELAMDAYGELDGAFNNAGMMGDMLPIPEMSTDNWSTVVETNLTSAYYASKYQIPAMKSSGAGSIIFTSSFVGTTASLPGMGAYAASKAGLIGLTQTLAVEHGAEGIRTNALLPGGTKTAMAGDIENDPEQLEFLNSLHALKRLAEPDEIARAAMFLLSDNSSFVTGSTFIVDGGNSINKI